MDTPDDELTIMDLVDDYVPDNTVIGPDNSDSDLTLDDFLYDPEIILQAAESSTLDTDQGEDLSDSQSVNQVADEITNNIENTTNNFGDVSDSETNVRVENIDLGDDTEQIAPTTETHVTNITNNTDPVVQESVSDLTVTTDNLVEVTVEGNKEQNDLLASIDKTLENQFLAEERDRRKNAIINEATPFDFLVNQKGISGISDSKGGMSAAELAAAIAAGSMLKKGGGGKDKPPKKDWKNKTTKEKFKTGGRWASATAIGSIVAATAIDKFGGLPSWIPFVGEDEDGNSDSPVIDAAATVAGVGGAYWAGKKWLGSKGGPSVVETPETTSLNPAADTDNQKKSESKDKGKESGNKAKGSKWAELADKKPKVTKAGMVGAAVSAGMTAHQIYEIRNDDTLTEDEKNQGTAYLSGNLLAGSAGAAAGTWGGAKLGAGVGLALGGPIGAAIGGTFGALAGGIAGYVLSDSSGLSEWGADSAVDLYEKSKELGFFEEAAKIAEESKTEEAQQDQSEVKPESVQDKTVKLDSEGLPIDTKKFPEPIIFKGKDLRGVLSADQKDLTPVQMQMKELLTSVIHEQDNIRSQESSLLLARVLETQSVIATDTKAEVEKTDTAVTKIKEVGTSETTKILEATASKEKELVQVSQAFDVFGNALTDSIGLLTTELSDLNENLWDIVSIFEGDSETNKRIEEIQRKYEQSQATNTNSMFSRMFDRSTVTDTTAKAQPAQSRPNYVMDTQTHDYTVANIDESDINVQPDQPIIMDVQQQTVPQGQQYGAQGRAKQARPEKATIKTVTRKDFDKSGASGFGGGAPTLANTPVHMEDATLNLINIGAL